MGVLNNPLGINLTDCMPITNSPFNCSDAGDGFIPPPPGSERMITETGIYMITETTLYDMITE